MHLLQQQDTVALEMPRGSTREQYYINPCLLHYYITHPPWCNYRELYDFSSYIPLDKLFWWPCKANEIEISVQDNEAVLQYNDIIREVVVN